jgi:hypothetical protein
MSAPLASVRAVEAFAVAAADSVRVLGDCSLDRTETLLLSLMAAASKEGIVSLRRHPVPKWFTVLRVMF